MKKQSTTRFSVFQNRVFATFALAIFSLKLSAATIYVKPTGNDANTGASWAQAFQSLNRALYMAGNADQIWVAAGTYKPQNQGPSTCNPYFYVGKNVKIYGGFAGTETALAQRNITANETILSGDIGTVGVATDNTRLIWFDHVSNATLLDGFTLTDYRRYDSTLGAAIYNDGSGAGRSSKPTVANCKFLNGSLAITQNASGYAIFNDGKNSGDASLTLTNCTVGAQNAATINLIKSTSSGANGKDKLAASNCLFTSGGGVISVGDISSGGVSTLELASCSFTANQLNLVSFIDGNSGLPSSFLMTNCTFSNNSLSAFNNAIAATGNVLKVFENCVFSGNSITGTQLIYSNNHPNYTTPTIFRKCSFMGNSAPEMLNLFSGRFNIENCQFSGNAGSVIGSNNANNSVSVTNTTFSGNNGSAFYGAIDTLEVKNSIIWGNAAGIAAAGNQTNVTHNIVQGGYAGLNNFDLDPDFLAPVDFNTAPNIGGNLRLNNCSPASNSGKNSFVPAGLTTDLDGSPRIYGGATGKVDLGAFEKQNNLTQIAYTDGDGDGYGIANAGIMPYCGTLPTGFAPNTTDCNDAVSTINPGVAEVCNGLDDNCDGITDNVTVCPVPTGISTSSITSTSALLNWTGGACPVSFQVQYRLSTVTTYTTLPVNAPAAGVQLTGLLPGSTYKWRVRAVCPPGNKYSAYTALQTFVTPASIGGTGGGTTNFSTAERGAANDDAPALSIFPNPTSGDFQIEFDAPISAEGTAFLYDLQGKLLLKMALPAGQSAWQMRPENLSAGVYLLRVAADEADFRGKVVVE